MVRHKTRWLLVRVDYADEIGRNELQRKIRDSLQVFGVAGARFAVDTHGECGSCSLVRVVGAERCRMMSRAPTQLHAFSTVRFWDPHSKLALVRVARDFVKQVRAAFLFVRQPVLSTTVYGSARTAKIGLIQTIREHYRNECLARDRKQQEKLCRQMQETFDTIIHTINH